MLVQLRKCRQVIPRDSSFALYRMGKMKVEGPIIGAPSRVLQTADKPTRRGNARVAPSPNPDPVPVSLARLANDLLRSELYPLRHLLLAFGCEHACTPAPDEVSFKGASHRLALRFRL